MKKRNQILISLFLLFFFKDPGYAKNLEIGEILFNQNCQVCHIDGKNIIIPEKNLKKKVLEANGMDTVEAIVYQVTNGKNGMPAFGGRLTEKEMEKISFYILNKFGKESEG